MDKNSGDYIVAKLFVQELLRPKPLKVVLSVASLLIGLSIEFYSISILESIVYYAPLFPLKPMNGHNVVLSAVAAFLWTYFLIGFTVTYYNHWRHGLKNLRLS